MAVVHELNIHKMHIDNCEDLSAFFIHAIDNKSFGYCEAYLLFDDYSTDSWKIIRDKQAGRSSDLGNTVNDNRPTKI